MLTNLKRNSFFACGKRLTSQIRMLQSISKPIRLQMRVLLLLEIVIPTLMQMVRQSIQVMQTIHQSLKI